MQDEKKETKAFFITTEDNPYNFFENFDEWLSFDEEKGYNTLSYVARISELLESESPDLLESEALDMAIEEILAIHHGGFYVKVFEP